MGRMMAALRTELAPRANGSQKSAATGRIALRHHGTDVSGIGRAVCNGLVGHLAPDVKVPLCVAWILLSKVSGAGCLFGAEITSDRPFQKGLAD